MTSLKTTLEILQWLFAISVFCMAVLGVVELANVIERHIKGKRKE